jgi:hydrogenase 3 maturation protease
MRFPHQIVALFDPPATGTLLVITVGNPLRADDGAGPFVAAAAQPRPGLTVLDAGEHPENIFDRATAVRPARIIFIDAADFGGVPGEVRVLPGETLSDHTLSTHRFPLPAVARILAEDTGAGVAFVGIQPATVAFGEKLSPQVQRAAEELIMLINGSAGDTHQSTKG